MSQQTALAPATAQLEAPAARDTDCAALRGADWFLRTWAMTGADDYPSLLALACTCHALLAAAQPRRAALAAACWHRAFGDATPGACPAWQRAEQLGRSAYEARWRWLHALRAGKPLQERTVAHEVPGNQHLKELDAALGTKTYYKEHKDDWWLAPEVECFAVSRGDGGDSTMTDVFVSTQDGVPCYLKFDLRSGALRDIELDEDLEAGTAGELVAFGGIALKCQPEYTLFPPEPVLLDLEAAAEMYVVQRPPPVPAWPRQQAWASAGAWSADGTRLAVWYEHPMVQQNDQQPAADGRLDLHVYALDPAAAPPAGELVALRKLRLPMFKTAAFGSGGCIYTVSMDDNASVLRAWDVVTGEERAHAALPVDANWSFNKLNRSAKSMLRILVPFNAELCIATHGMRIDVRCATTLELTGSLERPPLLGGHGQRVNVMHGIGDVLLSCDIGGVVLAWHVPTRTLLRRVGRNTLHAPPALGRSVSLVLTARGAATLEDRRGGRSQTRLFDWLP